MHPSARQERACLLIGLHHGGGLAGLWHRLGGILSRGGPGLAELQASAAAGMDGILCAAEEGQRGRGVEWDHYKPDAADGRTSDSICRGDKEARSSHKAMVLVLKAGWVIGLTWPRSTPSHVQNDRQK